jgi:hypothetical protein
MFSASIIENLVLMSTDHSQHLTFAAKKNHSGGREVSDDECPDTCALTAVVTSTGGTPGRPAAAREALGAVVMGSAQSGDGRSGDVAGFGDSTAVPGQIPPSAELAAAPSVAHPRKLSLRERMKLHGLLKEQPI